MASSPGRLLPHSYIRPLTRVSEASEKRQKAWGRGYTVRWCAVMARNVVPLLQKRQLSQCGWSELRQLAGSLTPSHISLAQIMDRDRQLLQGHVILGFSRGGHHLISYQCQIDATTSEHTYGLHWWWFNLHHPLRHMCWSELFRGETLHHQLHLLVCQTPDENHVVVVGCRRLCVEDDRRPCYVTILPSPCTPPSPSQPPSLEEGFSMHFKFDLLPPFPAFIPSLSLRIPGCVLLNTGDSLLALSYSIGAPSADHTPSTDGSGRHRVSTSHAQQVFAWSTHTEESSTLPASSPSHLLPVDVYCGDRPLTDITRLGEKVCECVVVRQLSLDVELWMNEVLQGELEGRGFTFHSLTDYDLQLVEVCDGDVVFLVVVMLEASGCSPSVTDSYSVEITASWNVYTGHARAVQFSDLKPSPILLNLGTQGRWNPAASLALNLRKVWQLPTSSQLTVRAFSNHTVFTGKSLHSLHHPYLPVSVVLSSRRTRTTS